jgi:hypothetical protein
MRKFMLGAAMAASVAGCATVGGVSTISAAAVQADAASICNWEPAAADIATVVASLTGTGGAVVVTANMVAQAICNAVKATAAPASARLRATPLPAAVYVNGVLVHRAP